MVLIALLASMASFGIVFFIIYFYGTGGVFEVKQRVRDRIRQDTTASDKGPTGQQDLRKTTNLSQIAFIRNFYSNIASAETVAMLLKTARIGMSVSMFCMISVLTGILVFLILVNFDWSPYLKVMVAVTCALGPFLTLKMVRKRYVARFDQHLPDTLGILSNAIKVGRNLESSIEVVAQSGPHPVSDEFGIVRTELKLGLPLKKALNNLHRRVGGNELKILIIGISIHDELGGNFSEILDNLQTTIRERYELRREIKTLSTQGVASAFVLYMLPLFFVSLWMNSDPKVFFAFINSPPGKIGLVFCIVSQICAFFWMRAIVNIKD